MKNKPSFDIDLSSGGHACFNPFAVLNTETDFVMELLVQMAAMPVDDATKELATKVALQEVVKGEVTLLCLVDAFDCVPKLREFSSALRKYTLVGHYGSHFDNSVV